MIFPLWQARDNILCWWLIKFNTYVRKLLWCAHICMANFSSVMCKGFPLLCPDPGVKSGRCSHLNTCWLGNPFTKLLHLVRTVHQFWALLTFTWLSHQTRQSNWIYLQLSIMLVNDCWEILAFMWLVGACWCGATGCTVTCISKLDIQSNGHVTLNLCASSFQLWHCCELLTL